MPDIELRSAQNVARRPTSGISRLVSSDVNPGGSGTMTSFYKREAEAPFQRVRLAIYSRETVATTGWTGVLASTETPLRDTQARRFTPTSGGASNNAAASVTNPAGWRTVTFGGSPTGTVPAAASANRPACLRSDWITCPSLPRTDGSLRHYLLSRVQHPGATGNTHTVSNGPGSGTGFNLWNTATAPWYREFWTATLGSDGVGTLTNMPAGNYSDGNWPFWIDFEFDYGIPTRSIMCIGDSTYASGGFQPNDYGQWLWQACARKSTPAAPIHAFNGAASSQSVATFGNFLPDLIAAGARFTDVVIPVGSPNDSNDGAFGKFITDRNKAYVLNHLDLCDSIGARMFLATRIPNDLYSAGNANEDERLAGNAWARGLCAANPTRLTLVDFDATLSNSAYPARFATGFRGDDFHESAAGIAAMADTFVTLLN